MTQSDPDSATLRHYVQRKLPAEEEEKVELWLMAHPEAVEDLKLDLAFERLLEPDPVSNSTTQRALWAPPFKWMLRPAFIGLGLTTVLALSLVLLAGIRGEQGADIRSARVIDLVQQRDTRQRVFDVALSAEEFLILRLFPDEGTRGPFSIDIRSSSLA